MADANGTYIMHK